MEPPSSELVRTLRELKLSGPIELRQAAKLVRTLAQDLPTFDSVWIDALVQLRCLTLHQAQALTESAGQGLRLGSHVAVDRLGRDSWYEHFSGKSLETGQSQLITSISIDGLNHASIVERLGLSIGTLKKLDQRYLICPSAVEVVDQRVLVTSELATDRDLRGLMTRRGRWKPALVRDLSAQLATGLQTLERSGLCHGDVRLETVRISQRGISRLMLPGVLVAVHPELTIHAAFTPECTECLAPERVGVGAVATPRGDQYALGCLMWHLLTGRPPYLSADPLTKLARHRTGQISDVRELAPDTPDDLWKVIVRLTHRDPEQRFANWGEVLNQLGHATLAGQRRLTRMTGQLERPAISARDWGPLLDTAGRWAKVTSVVGVVLLAAVWFPANRTYLLNIAGSLQGEGSNSSDITSATDEPPATSDVGGDVSPPYRLPTPDADGVVQLNGRGPWRARELQSQGTLILRGDPQTPAVIVVDGDPLRLIATAVRLENVVVQRDGNVTGAGGIQPLVETTSDVVQIDHCILMDVSTFEPLVHLTVGTGEALAAARLQCRNTMLVSQGAAFHCDRSLEAVEAEQTLRLGTGPLVESTLSSNMSIQQMRLAQVTFRQSGPLWRLPAGACNVSMTVDDCVLEFAAGNAWLEFIGVGTPLDWPAQIEIEGAGTIASAGAIVGTRISRDLPITKVDESSLVIDGIFGGEFEFAAGASLMPDDSSLQQWVADAPRQSPTNPGMDAARMIDPTDEPIRTGELE